MANILVVGDLMLDIAAAVRPLTTYEGATVSYTGERWRYYPGGAANVASIIQGMGHDVTICGCLASDWAGWELYKLLPDESWVSFNATATTVKLRGYTGDGVALRLDREVPEPLGCPFPSDITKFDGAAFSDYYKGVFGRKVDSAKIRSIIDSGIPTVVDPHVRGRNGLWANATIATPNEREHDAIGSMGTRCTAVTMGRDGANLFYGDKFASSHRPLIPCETPQVVGAGDAFTAALAVALSAQTTDMPTAVDIAVEFAADYVKNPRT